MGVRSDSRFAMAAPAALLFLATCIAQVIAGIRGGTVLVRGSDAADRNQNLSGDDVDFDSGDGAAVDGSISSNSGDETEDEDVSLGHHHGHHGRNKNYSPQNVPSNNHDDDGSFDFYVYSMSYQPEFCRENDERFDGCRKFDEGWEGQLTIHGLWPSRNDGSWPATCTNEQLDTSLLEGLSDDLAAKWPNVKALDTNSPGHASFWSHEWTKHGTCSGLAQGDYFATALDLLLPTPSAVRENYGSTVKRTELEGADDGYLGGDMSVLVCKGGYLSEVRVCYEKLEGGNVGERVTCPESTLREDSCGDEVRIASFGDAGGDAPTAVE